MNPFPPSIQLDPGLAIGYKEPLARFEEKVKLTGGTHFLLARNGRGKSTLLRTLAGSLKKLSGDFSTEGFMQYLPEDMRFDAEITPKSIFKSLLPKAKQKPAFELAERIELDVNKLYGRLSTGNRRKTALIMAEFSIKENCGNILLLDEPFSGLDAFAREIFEKMWRDSSENVLRLVSCHPDYDSMVMPSVLMIEGERVSHHSGESQSWSTLKSFLN
ncbi:ATP-binding cassette domain-containing protein [Luteolibacter sp. AS25]|uniref:ATP-binding cassette domain-containing protein n=1 Tax=Luteolibacter sp. AS25 TaxID=3135776 RepID=UPI00398AF94D